MSARTELVRYVIIVALVASVITGCDDPKPNIIIISIDTLRADHLGCYGNTMWDISPSPNIDKIAEQGIVFENFFATRGQTSPSIASMLTGKYPVSHHLRDNGQVLTQEHLSFITLLHDNRGYDTAGFASNLYKELNPYDRAGSKPNWWTRGLNAYGDGYNNNFKGEVRPGVVEDQWTWDERVEKQTANWIRNYDPNDDKPFFLWTHFYDPHKPYHPHPSCPDFYPEYAGPLKPCVDGGSDKITPFINEFTRSNKPMSASDHKKVMALYDASIYGVDMRIGRLMEQLKRKGMLDNTWIFITADHGDELGDHNNYYYHGASIYNSVLKIPLVVKGPEGEYKPNSRSRALVQNVDIAPTILKLAGAEPPAGNEGCSLIGLISGEASKIEREFAVFEWQSYIYSYTDGVHKYIFNPEWVWVQKPPYFKNNTAFKYEIDELYNLKTDPHEKINIFSSEEGEALRMRKMLLWWLDQPGHDRFGEHSKIYDPSMKAFEQLGYPGSKRRSGKRDFKPEKPKIVGKKK